MKYLSMVLLCCLCGSTLAEASGRLRPVAYTDTEPIPHLDARAKVLMQWIGQHTRYSVDFEPPTFAFRTDEELKVIGYGGKVAKHVAPPRAVFTPGVIFLNHAFTPWAHDFLLLHELVHHVQWENGAEFPCEAMREKEAYELHMQFSKEFGMGETFNLGVFTLTCG